MDWLPLWGGQTAVSFMPDELKYIAQDLPAGLPPDVLIRQLTHSAEIEQKWAHYLTDLEIGRRAGMKNEARRKSFTLGRVALRSLLSEQLSLAPKDVPIVIEPSGMLSSPGSGLRLSLAHSGTRAIAIVSPRNVGVDLEAIRIKPDTLLSYILADSEKSHIRNLPLTDSDSLFLCWTLKEAVLKANGTGLRKSPKKVTLQIDVPSRTAIATDPNAVKWNASFVILSEYVISIAYDPSYSETS